MTRTEVALLAGAVAAVALATAVDGAAYRFLLGEWPPLPVAAVVVAVSAVALRVLAGAGVGEAGGAAGVPRRPSLAWISAGGALLTLPAVALDLLGAFPRELNAPLPGALLVYPSIAVLAELVLHVVPLAAADGMARVAGGRAGTGIRRGGLAVACLLEPVMQVLWGVDRSPAWANACVGVHLLLFNVLGLFILRRRGFPAVVLYRLAYYLVWHLAWGRLRLDLLF
jgi:hypothetical protein